MPRSSASSARARERQKRIHSAAVREYQEHGQKSGRGPTVFSDAPAVPGIAILPLRLFLGLTFVYAAWQKLTDPGFFDPAAGTYIGHQLLGFSRGSPISGLLHLAADYAVAVGVLTVITELVIGLLILLGLFVRPAALVGLFLNLVFFLSASWHTYPYFMGSDIVFVVCWLTLLLTGPGPFALGPLVRASLARRLQTLAGARLAAGLQRFLSGPLPREDAKPIQIGERESEARSPAQLLVTRAEVLAAGLGALVLIALGLAPRGGPSAGVAFPSTGTGGATLPPARSPGSGAANSAGSGSTTPTGGTKIGNISQLPVNSAGMVSDPKSGDPAIIVRTSGSQVYAYDAVCTHAGCTVQYDSQSKLLICPCHGGEFDPAHGAQVVSGPPPSPLTSLQMTIDSHGNIYLV